MFSVKAHDHFCLEGAGVDAGRLSTQSANIEITNAPYTTVWRISAFQNKQRAIETQLGPFGFHHLPAPGQFAASRDARLAWAGDKCWHLMPGETSNSDENALKQALLGLAAVTSAGDGLLRVLITGADAAPLLAKACVLDLDRFRAGHCAITQMAHTRIYLHCLSYQSYDLFVPTSHGASFWDWLHISAQEYLT